MNGDECPLLDTEIENQISIPMQDIVDNDGK